MRASSAVVVVNWNGIDFLEGCLQSLRLQTRPPSEVVVVDNASEDGSPDLVAREFPDFTLLRLDRNLGFAAGANRGVEATSTELVALLNSDARAQPRWLDSLCEAWLSNPGFSMFASCVILDGTDGLLDTAGDDYTVGGFVVKRGWRQPAGGAFAAQREVFSPSGCAALYTRDLWSRTGGFDESYFAFGEDVDLGFRARLVGYRCLYVPGAVVRHRYRASARRVPSLAVRLASRNEIATLVKDMPTPVIARHLPRILAYQLVTTASHMVRRQRWPFLCGRAAALRELPALLARRKEVQSKATAPWQELSDALQKRWWSAFWGLSSTWQRLSRYPR